MQNTHLPDYITKYFWGDDLSELDLQKHQDYISQTILDKGDTKAVAWLFSQMKKETIKQKLPKFKLSPKSKHFWEVYLS